MGPWTTVNDVDLQDNHICRCLVGANVFEDSLRNSLAASAL